MPESIDIKIPKLGLTMTEATISEWLIAPGSRFAKGAAVVVIETDKTTSEIEAPGDGVLIEILEEVGAIVPPGATIGRWTTDDPSTILEARSTDPAPVRIEPIRSILDSADAQIVEPPVAAPLVPDLRELAVTVPPPARSTSSPYARRLARELHIDITSLPGSGQGGRVQSRDVRKYEEENLPRESISNASSRLLRFTAIANVDKLLATGRYLGEHISSPPYPVVAFIIYAAAHILRQSGGHVDIVLMDSFGLTTKSILPRCDRLSLTDIVQYLSTVSSDHLLCPNEAMVARVAVCDMTNRNVENTDYALPPGCTLMISASAPTLVCQPDEVGRTVFRSCVRLVMVGERVSHPPAKLAELLRALAAALAAPMRMLL